MAEWFKAAVLKTVEPRGSGGSNPSSSATQPETPNPGIPYEVQAGVGRIAAPQGDALMSRRVKWAIGIGVAVLLAVVVVASIKSRDKSTTKITTAKVAKVPLVATVNCNGRVRARIKVDISSQVMGQIVTLACVGLKMSDWTTTAGRGLPV